MALLGAHENTLPFCYSFKLVLKLLNNQNYKMLWKGIQSPWQLSMPRKVFPMVLKFQNIYKQLHFRLLNPPFPSLSIKTLLITERTVPPSHYQHSGYNFAEEIYPRVEHREFPALA